MSHQYIVLTGDADASGDAEAALAAHGIRRCLALGKTRLLVSEKTPLLIVDAQTAIVGELYDRSGTRITERAALPDSTDHTRFRQFILDHGWGDYVLIHSTQDREGSASFMRSPCAGGDLRCTYSLRHGSGFLASDISLPIQAGLHRSAVDWEFVAYCIAHPHLKLERTALSGVRELLPGCVLRISGDDVHSTTAWSPWTFASSAERHGSHREAADEVCRAVQAVVAAWAPSGEHILLELSGGLDSSILGACLQDTPAHVVCCTLTTAIPGADERHYARLVSQSLGACLEVHELGLTDVKLDFKQPAYATTPRVGLLHHIVDQAMQTVGRRYDITSFFSGSGGDSAFSYLATAAPAADAFRAAGIGAGMSAVRELAALHQCTLWKAGKLTARKLIRPSRSPSPSTLDFIAKDKISDIQESHPWFSAPVGALVGDRERIADLAGNQIFRDGSPRGMTRRLRMPLLSQPVLEACLRTPSWMWISGGRNRAVARMAFADRLPPQIHARRSKGNFVSFLGAAYRQRKHQMLDFLLTGELEAHGLLDADALRQFVTNELPARDRSFMRILDLCMIENWARHQSDAS